ncbi:MAG TPA: hypothetical protein VLA24_04470 [Pseudomonadales bacterium]|nr:hypothetical protein [Pseudomonadales bacterium]
MKISLALAAVVLVVAGYFGQPYIDMLRDGQPFGCVLDQINLDMTSDGGIKDELARKTNAANCKAQAVLERARN